MEHFLLPLDSNRLQTTISIDFD